jgi:hypothetical protein
MNQTISQWLNALIPMNQIVGIMNVLLPAFVAIAVLILICGYYFSLMSKEDVFAPTLEQITLFACIALSPLIMSIAQDIANSLVMTIGGAVPGLNWLIVNNPQDDALSMNFDRPFQIIGQYVSGKVGAAPTVSIWELNKWADYVIRAAIIFGTGLVAALTVFIMQMMLILQKLIIVFSKPLMPIFIACLALPAAKGSAQNFLKNVAGVLCWPVGWAIVHIGTMAAFNALQPPSWHASFGELLLSLLALSIACLVPVLGTIGAPFMIARMVTSGTNFAHSMMGGLGSAAGQHAANLAGSAGAVGGALAGAYAGPAGAMAGATLGGKAGGAAASLISSASQSVSGINGGQQPVPSSRSAKIADAAIGLIKRRA